MELERPEFSLLNETLNHLEVGVVGTIKNLVRIKNYKFLIHMKLQNCEQINKDEIDLALLNEEIIPLSNVQPGSLLGCLHPQNKKWMRCYVVSILHQEVYVALCDTGEMTKTKNLKDIPNRYKSIPIITFEAEVPCVCPYGKLQHLKENFKDYIVNFEPFTNKLKNKTHKKMKLTYKNSCIDLIIKKWDLQSYMNIDNTNYDLLMFNNGSTVTIGKVENYDWRHIFVRSADRFVNVCKELQTFCKNVSSIQIDPIIGDIIAVKCIDKFYRGKIIDVIDESNFYLYLMDTGFVISASTDCIVNLSDTLKKIPPTVCLVGLKGINFKPWTPETCLYITSLFENSTAMIMEYTDFDIFGLDSVVLTIINNSEDVNGHLNELLKFVEEPQKDDEHASLNYFLDSTYKNLQTTRIIPVKVDNLVKSDSLDMPENIESLILPSSGSLVFMTGFVSLNEIYIKHSEDYNDEFDKFIETVNNFCSSATPINRPLIIGEIIGALSTSDDTIYRGKVLKKIDHNTYLIQYIDFGDNDFVSLSNIFLIPKVLMTPPSKVMKITLKGVNSNQINVGISNYISNLMSNYVPMKIELSSKQSLNDVILTTVNDNEIVNERVNELLNDMSSSPTEQSAPEINEGVPKLKKGDLVCIECFIDVSNIFVHKVEDITDEFLNFINNVHAYCSAETPIGKLPKVNDIIGAKSISDGLFYRAKVLKKVNEVSYNVQFIDYGIEENVSLSDIVSLSTEIKQVIPTVILVKLKDVSFDKLNEAAREYVSLIGDNEYLIIDDIEENTNEVILKTEKNENVNNHLNMLIIESNCIAEKIKISSSKEVEKELDMDSPIESSLTCHSSSLEPGNMVYMTAFVNLNEMYIRKLEDYNDDFNNFLDKVDQYCSSAAPIDRPLEIGEIVGAQSTLDNSFYRGQVLDKIDENTYLIQYIDFGDKDYVPLTNVFSIPTDFMIPSTVKKINLKGINSDVLNAEASNYIGNLLSSYEPMTVDFNPELPFKDVTLTVIKNNENVMESLNKLLKVVNNSEVNGISEDVVNTAFDAVHEDGLISELSQDIVKDKFHYETNKLKDGDVVYITAYVDLYNIFVRKIDDNNDEFQKFIETVNTFCTLGNTSESKPPELNQIVGAKSSVDGFFYRARIIEKTDEENYALRFIDFGSDDNVNVADIVPLSLQLQQVTSSVYLVGLKGSTFENINMEGHNYLESLMLLSEMMKIEFNDLSAVSLTVINQEQNVIDYLNELHVDGTIMGNTINNPVDSSSGMNHISHEISIPQIPPLTNKSIVTIHAFISLKSIYIKMPFDESNINKFLKDFSVFCLTSSPINRNPTVGDIFGIESSIDGLFYRGAVIETLNENQFKVVFFDLGSEDVVSKSCFVEIPETLKQVPRTIYSVCLKDIHSQNLNNEAMSYVNMLCDNMPLIIEFDENSPNGLNAVTLTTLKTQQNVNDHLAKLLMEKERDSPETVQMLSKGDIVYISTFEDLQTVYVRRINNGTDKFKSFLEKFSSSCTLENPMERDPEVGEIVAAKEKNGSKFYRAEVISKMDHEYYNVCFIDFGSWNTVHKSNIVQPKEFQLQNCSPPFMVGLFGLDSEPLKDTVMRCIKKMIQTESFIIDSITEQNKVVLISVSTQCNMNKEIEKIIDNDGKELKIHTDIYACNDVPSTKKSIIKYYIPPLEVPIQVWVAEKITSSKYSVYTYDSRIEFMQLEKQIFEDSKQFVSIKRIEMNKPCIVYFSPSWYRGEILEVIDRVTAKIGLVDVGNFSVIRNIKEIFHMPSKYKGKSLLLNIEIQPEPKEHLSITTFKIIAKKQVDTITIVELVDSPPNQSYDDLENVGLPSFSSTPIPEDSGQFQYGTVNDQSGCTVLCPNPLISSPSFNTSLNKRFSNILTIKDVQYAKWPMGSLKTLTLLSVYQDCLIMRDHMIDDALTDLEAKIQDHCMKITSYCPVENELCLAKYSDELWYRALCIKTATPTDSNYTIYFLDWGIEYLVNAENVCKMSKDFVYLPATAHKCFLKGSSVVEWSNDTSKAVFQLMFTQMNCEIIEKVATDTYTITCNTLKNLIDS